MSKKKFLLPGEYIEYINLFIKEAQKKPNTSNICFVRNSLLEYSMNTDSFTLFITKDKYIKPYEEIIKNLTFKFERCLESGCEYIVLFTSVNYRNPLKPSKLLLERIVVVYNVKNKTINIFNPLGSNDSKFIMKLSELLLIVLSGGHLIKSSTRSSSKSKSTTSSKSSLKSKSKTKSKYKFNINDRNIHDLINTQCGEVFRFIFPHDLDLILTFCYINNLLENKRSTTHFKKTTKDLCKTIKDQTIEVLEKEKNYKNRELNFYTMYHDIIKNTVNSLVKKKTKGN